MKGAYSALRGSGVFRVLVEKPERVGDRLGDSCVDGRIILRWNLRKWEEGVWTGSSWLNKGTSGGRL
jgi:hypothetical protein